MLTLEICCQVGFEVSKKIIFQDTYTIVYGGRTLFHILLFFSLSFSLGQLVLVKWTHVIGDKKSKDNNNGSYK